LLSDLQFATATSESKLIDITEQTYLFKEAASGFDRNPGGSFATMRTQYQRIVRKLAPYDWIEAESSKDHTFSEGTALMGCSNNSALALRTQIAPNAAGYVARYKTNVRSKDEQEVWIAARIPQDQRKNIRVVVEGQTLTFDVEPISLYGSGFGWYRLGTTQLVGNTAQIEVQVFAGDAANILLDTIVLFPGKFEPKGVFQPPLVRG
jgi:hypothetical protein